MKRYIYRYIFILATLVLGASCAEKISDSEILDGKERVQIDVTYSLSGEEVKAVTLGHASVKKVLDVNVNSEGLKWNLESNREWCVVVPEEHRGSGSVTLDIAANEDFEEREPATLTFVAGDFRGFQITVTQRGSSFIIGQPYFVAGIAGDTYTVNVTTLADTEWNCTQESWMEVSKGTPVVDGDYVTTPLSITVAANDAASRYGAVVLSDAQASDNIWIHQFGTDLEYDENGNIFLQGDEQASLTLTAPSFTVDDVQVPGFAESSVVENGDGTATVSFTFESNLSDCAEPRSVEVSLRLSNASSSIVNLPSMVQDYIPANGLVTSNGLLAFAKAVAEGRSTADWEEDGVVVVKKDIDMKDVTGWTGIGTAQASFAGKFNGGGYSVTNLTKSSVGIFGYCQGASISNIVLGKGCSLYFSGEFSGLAGSVGGIVAVAKETTVTGCEFAASIEYAGENDNDEPAYVGGVVGYADAKSTVTKSKMTGNLTISTGSSQMECYVGGVAGYSEGTVTNNEVSGKITFTSGISSVVAGGVTSAVPAGAVVSNNSYMGTMTLGGSSSNVVLGGLYGTVKSDRTFDSVSDKSVNMGSISVDAYASSASTELYVGGFVGKAEGGVDLSIKGYECQTNITLDQTADRQSAYLCIGGVLGGCDHEQKCKSVAFENITNKGIFSNKYAASAVTSKVMRGLVGGVAGYVNAESASFNSCSNTGEIGKLESGANSANTKGYISVYGGIAGVVMGGDAEFVKCENKGDIINKHYSNNVPGNVNNGWNLPCISAGILGAFDYMVTSNSKNLIIDNCQNSGSVQSYRGVTAGIVGYARNAKIQSCTNFGSLGQNSTSSNNSAYKGGIACWLTDSSIEDCVAKCNVFTSNPASAVQSSGGILSISMGGGVSVTNCSYYGNLTVNQAASPEACGGIVSTPEADTVIKDCKFGGTVNGITISANNVEENAVGNGLGQLSNITLWDGNL